MHRRCLILLLCFNYTLGLQRQIEIDFGPQSVKPLNHFWKSCGWCPPDPHSSINGLFLSESEIQNHAFIGSVPHGGISYVRIHFLLELIGISSSSSVDCDSQTIFCFTTGYLSGKALNWTNLDSSMDILFNNSLYPGFEIMGNPGSVFTSFQDDAQLKAFGSVVSLIASRYISRYGIEAVRQWRFESWNEPDGECHKQLDAGITCDIASFLNYWDTIEHALHSVDSELIFGGPASDGDKSFLRATVAHCVNGTHYVTKAPGCGQISYFNLHSKGHSDAAHIFSGEAPILEWVYAATRDTAYENVSLGNDEADPLEGWNKQEDFRQDARYAALVPKAIAQHLQHLIFASEYPGPLHVPVGNIMTSWHPVGFRYDVLSNDNAFLNYGDTAHMFNQRTLVTRFWLNESGTIETVRKPVINVMYLLSLLGDVISVNVSGVDDTLVDMLGVLPTIATSGQKRVSVLLYASPDGNDINGTYNVQLTLRNSPLSGRVAVGVHLLDNAHGSSYTAWRAAGSPSEPSASALADMRRDMEVPQASGYPRVVSVPPSELTVTLALPGVALVHVCEDTGRNPGSVGNVRLHVTPTQSPAEVHVMWAEVAGEFCIRTYRVMYATHTGGASVHVNQNVDTVFTLYAHAQNGTGSAFACGCYSVVAEDYFGRLSAPSKPACLDSC